MFDNCMSTYVFLPQVYLCAGITHKLVKFVATRTKRMETKCIFGLMHTQLYTECPVHNPRTPTWPWELVSFCYVCVMCIQCLSDRHNHDNIARISCPLLLYNRHLNYHCKLFYQPWTITAWSGREWLPSCPVFWWNICLISKISKWSSIFNTSTAENPLKRVTW